MQVIHNETEMSKIASFSPLSLFYLSLSNTLIFLYLLKALQRLCGIKFNILFFYTLNVEKISYNQRHFDSPPQPNNSYDIAANVCICTQLLLLILVND